MPKRIDYAGRKFGKLTVDQDVGRDSFGAVMWLCKCDCGNETIVRGRSLKQNVTRSCGCGIREAASRPRTHGKTHTPLYQRWRAMIGRCTLESGSQYRNYGGRGIQVCARWADFAAFAEDMGAGFDQNLELDRIDVNGDYSRENCRWASKKQQQRNRRNNHRVEWRGQTLTVYEWAERLGHKPNTLIYRLRRGWPVDRAMTFGAAVLLELANE